MLGGNHYRIELQTKDGDLRKDAVFKNTFDVGWDKPFKTLVDMPDDFYSSDFYADQLIEFLSAKPKSKPFFAYLPFTAPHWPLQAPPEIIAKYKGKYDDGPEALRQRRLSTQVKLGLLDDGVEPYPLVGGKEWSDMSQDERKYSSKTMEIYAAMVERMDYNIGKVVDYLEEQGQLDNTFIVFHSDNGAEGAVLEALPVIGPSFKTAIETHYNNSYENLGNADSWIWYGPRWAQAATAPSRMNKGYITQGGIRCPAIVRYPSVFPKGKISHEFTTVMDIYPTVLALAGIPQPLGKFKDRSVVPVRGRSWVDHFKGKGKVYNEMSFNGWELFGQQAVRRGKWKALFIPQPLGTGEWELYDLDNDPGEIHDLASKEKDKMAEMIGLWEQYENDAGVLLSPDIPRFL
jgi:arylsulfatase